MDSNKIKILSILILTVVFLIGCKTNTENKIPEEKIQSENSLTDKQKDVIKFDLFIEMSKGEIKDDTSSRIYSLIKNAKMGDLNDIYYMISEYCWLKYKKTDLSENECQKMIKALVAKGDILKDKSFEEIKKDKDNLVKRLSEFQALLRSQRKASGGDTYFSTENVEKINVETKKIMRERFKDILKNGSSEELYQELLLVITYTPVSCGTMNETKKSPKEFGLYGSEICGFKQKIINRARQKLANLLESKNLCELTNEEKSKIIKDLHNCKKLINDEEICKKINNKEIVLGYNKLVDKYCSDNKKVNCTTKSAEDSRKKIEEIFKEEEELFEESEEIPQDKEQRATPVTGIKINYFDNVLIGWDFEIVIGNIIRYDVYTCIFNCGFEAPLELISEEPLICYDFMINEEVPCDMRPMIPEEGKFCIEDCLMQLD
ncbi:MAG: hypothetical protein U9O66_03475 [Patescibacteria group bacterium]|nr:hypothetical protein [Patescibacteria group bacterium]